MSLLRDLLNEVIQVELDVRDLENNVSLCFRMALICFRSCFGSGREYSKKRKTKENVLLVITTGIIKTDFRV